MLPMHGSIPRDTSFIPGICAMKTSLDRSTYVFTTFYNISFQKLWRWTNIYQQLNLVYGCCYSAVLPLIKTAILLDWCRIFVHFNCVHDPFWWGCMAIICLQCVWGAACIILLNLQCRPHEAIWKFYLPSTCYSLPDVMLTSASVQVASDIIMFLLPQRIIWSLRINWQKKIGVSIIFSAGIL